MARKMTFAQVVRENPEIDWKDISGRNRTYHYLSERGIWSIMTYHNTVAINVNRKSGGHRIVTEDGIGHYVKPDWKTISWVSLDGSPVFRF